MQNNLKLFPILQIKMNIKLKRHQLHFGACGYDVNLLTQVNE